MIEIIEPADPRADLDALAALEAITFRNPWTRQMLRVEFEQIEAVVAYVVRTEAHSVAAYCAGRVLGEELHVPAGGCRDLLARVAMTTPAPRLMSTA